MGSRSSPADGCVLAVLLVAEVAFGYVFALIFAWAGHPTGMLVWMGVMALTALGAAALLFRRGYSGTGAAQLMVAALLVAFAALAYDR
ncbi:hypothetical protein ACGFNV_10375 [Streptomyces sp. NPDC048751]|uniref:hypothetical protein n=1 Tax=Streptomyces sp. NPDC048751 TaxID=3365591 RepID=UPI00371864D4